MQFRGLDTAEKCAPPEKELFVAEKDLPALEEGEYYDYQLIGLEAVTEDGRDRHGKGRHAHGGKRHTCDRGGERGTRPHDRGLHN